MSQHLFNRGLKAGNVKRLLDIFIGAGFLARGFSKAVSEPVALHVPAKRFLAATEPGYIDRLSAASLQSLELQGGPMSEPECEAFRAHPYHKAALRLRGYDEMGKVVGAAPPPVIQRSHRCQRTHVHHNRAAPMRASRHRTHHCPSPASAKTTTRTNPSQPSSTTAMRRSTRDSIPGA